MPAWRREHLRERRGRFGLGLGVGSLFGAPAEVDEGAARPVAGGGLPWQYMLVGLAVIGVGILVDTLS
jgi:hypothetical protein